MLEDGTELPADLVVFATGYGSMNGWVADLIDQETADRLGKVWGLGSDTTKDPGPVGGRAAQHVEADPGGEPLDARRQPPPVAALLALPRAPAQGAATRGSTPRSTRCRRCTTPAEGVCSANLARGLGSGHDAIRLHPDDRAERPAGAGALRRRAPSEAGFDFEVSSDHYSPWLDRAGPRAVRLDGARRGRPGDRAGRADDLRDLPDDALPPGRGRAEGRDRCRSSPRAGSPSASAAGENLNEHVVGEGWPAVDDAPGHARRGDRDHPRAAHRRAGRPTTASYFQRRLRPHLGPARAAASPIARRRVAASESIERFAPLADHLIAVEPDGRPDHGVERRRRRAADRRAARARSARSRSAGTPTRTTAVERAHEQFRWFAGGWAVNADLPDPGRVRRRDASSCGPRTSPSRSPAAPTSTRSSRRSGRSGRPASPTSRSCRSATRRQDAVPRRGRRAAAGEAARGRRLTAGTLTMDRTPRSGGISAHGAPFGPSYVPPGHAVGPGRGVAARVCACPQPARAHAG